MVITMRFRDDALAAFWDDPLDCAPSWLSSSLRKQLFRRLQMLEAAHTLNDLRVPPGNHLEKLRGNRAGTYSIRVNDQWRLCFRWESGEAIEVELCDYHG